MGLSAVEAIIGAGWPFLVFAVLAIALAAATAVGIFFGTVPATRAAQMNPVEALKYE